ncbi:MAG: SAM-dependent methyltransferase [Candidatus Nealsonbacteria bacterium]
MYKLKDQFYTKPKVAEYCYKKFKKISQDINVNLDNYIFIEPSAGCGCFYQLLPKKRRIGIDIDPKKLLNVENKGIIKSNYLIWYPKNKKKKYIVIGNPPFGYRSKQAINFFNHSAEIADIIAFIVPNQFQKYSVHSKLVNNFNLVKEYKLKENSFYTPDKKDFNVRCVFQIWTANNITNKNIRILTPPPIKHPDFKMYQYNNTPQALKVFNENWDFAVPRQGYENYTRRETIKDKCEKNKQWILFKAKSNEILNRLLNIDFAKISKKNTVVYGFGKADVIMEYRKIYD